ncbi:MAG: winged helix-turn-helix transcriptional regulator [Actinomycetes bacterium]
MAALDLLGRRWTLRLLWELREGPIGPRAMLVRCTGMSSSVLYQRLRELEAAGLVTQTEVREYKLTDQGTTLAEAIAPLDQWANRWAER